MKIVFVSAPFRAANGWEVYHCCHQVEALCAEIVKLGALPVAAHVNSRNHHGLQHDEWWLAAYCTLLKRCDVVLMDLGWEKSTGCKVEHNIALLEDKQTVYSLEQLKAWLQQHRVLFGVEATR